MIAANPVDPHQLVRIDMRGTVGPHSPWPRRRETPPFPVGRFIALGALLFAGYAVAGTLAAAPVDVDPGPAIPLAKREPAPAGPAGMPVPGEFRLGPGNNMPPGVVVRLGVPSPFPGDFRLAPGNNQPPGVVPVR